MRFAHVGICARDPRALAQWYREVLGLEVASDNERMPPTIFLRCDDGTEIEIYPSSSDSDELDNKRQGIRHLAFLSESLEGDRERLARVGAAIIDDVMVHPNGSKTLFFRDGEGNILHFLQRRAH